MDPESSEENFLRESILRVLTEGFDEPLAKKVLNALTPLIGERSKAFETALQVHHYLLIYLQTHTTSP